MNRSGNIGAAKTMDSVFDNFTDEELEQDLMFDEDDQLVEIVEGYTEEGNTIFEEDEEIFKIADQIMNSDNTGDSPAEVKKDTEDILGPDSKTDQNIKDIEDVDKTKLDDSQTIANLNKNGDSEADKELGLDKLEDEYHKTASVEEAYEKWLHTEAYDYDKENEAEGTDDVFGKKIDNSLPTDDSKNKEDENYQKTADASVKEEYDYDKENEAEGTDDKFGPKIDNSLPTKDSKADEDENYNATNDASVKESACDCGKDDCPICNPKSEMAPTSAPVADKTGAERHEESNNETISDGNGEGIATAGQVDDNSAPKPEDMTPDCSPKSDNGDIMDDGCKGCKDDECGVQKKEEVSPVIDKEKDAETPVTDESDKGEEKKDAEIEESFAAWLHEEDDLEKEVGDADISGEDDGSNNNGTSSADEGCCGKGSELGDATNDGTKPADECGSNVPANGPAKAAGVDNVAQVAENNAHETDPDTTSVSESFESWLNETEEVEIPCPDAEDHVTEPIANKGDEIENPETKIDGKTPEEVSKGLNEADEAPTQADVKDAASTEVEDTESELDDDLAAVADDAEGEGDLDLSYDPSDEELIDIAGGID